MPLIILSGHPCSGKTGIASQLEAKLRKLGLTVLIVSELSLGLDKNDAYKDGVIEKRTRGSLKAAVERNLRGDLVIILDSLNNIKGYRYELWCIAKAARTRYCCIHSDVPADVCKTWNDEREAEKYKPDIFKDLAGRLEVPDTRNRWDTPLFRMKVHLHSDKQDLDAVVACITGKPSAHQPGITNQPLEPTMATQNPELSSTNLLNELDRAAQEIVGKIAEEQSQAGADAIGNIELTGVILHLYRPVSLPELRKHKRGFLKLATQNNWLKVRTTENARQIFVEYLKENLQ